MISLSDLIVTQGDLRHLEQIDPMMEYVSNGGFWTRQYLEEYARIQNSSWVSPLIQITRFEDGLLYLHDGHHRSVATLLGGRDYLRDDEYNVTVRLYADYLEINHPNGWYTPFDPRIEMRKADFSSFKKMAKKLFVTDATAAAEWIRANTHQFRHPRTFHTIEELAMKLSGIRHERNVENERPAAGVGV